MPQFGKAALVSRYRKADDAKDDRGESAKAIGSTTANRIDPAHDAQATAGFRAGSLHRTHGRPPVPWSNLDTPSTRWTSSALPAARGDHVQKWSNLTSLHQL